MDGKGFAIIVAAFFTIAFAYSIRYGYGYGMLLPGMVATLGISKTEAGLISSACFGAYTAFSPLLGALSVATMCSGVGIVAWSLWLPVVLDQSSYREEWMQMRLFGFMVTALNMVVVRNPRPRTEDAEMPSTVIGTLRTTGGNDNLWPEHYCGLFWRGPLVHSLWQICRGGGYRDRFWRGVAGVRRRCR